MICCEVVAGDLPWINSDALQRHSLLDSLKVATADSVIVLLPLMGQCSHTTDAGLTSVLLHCRVSAPALAAHGAIEPDSTTAALPSWVSKASSRHVFASA